MRVVSSPLSRLVTTSSLSQIPSSSTIVSSKPLIIRDDDLSSKKVVSTSSEGAGATLSDSSCVYLPDSLSLRFFRCFIHSFYMSICKPFCVSIASSLLLFFLSISKKRRTLFFEEN